MVALLPLACERTCVCATDRPCNRIVVVGLCCRPCAPESNVRPHLRITSRGAVPFPATAVSRSVPAPIPQYAPSVHMQRRPVRRATSRRRVAPVKGWRRWLSRPSSAAAPVLGSTVEHACAAALARLHCAVCSESRVRPACSSSRRIGHTSERTARTRTTSDTAAPVSPTWSSCACRSRTCTAPRRTRRRFAEAPPAQAASALAREAPLSASPWRWRRPGQPRPRAQPKSAPTAQVVATAGLGTLPPAPSAAATADHT